jgi:glutamate dehydrogenase
MFVFFFFACQAGTQTDLKSCCTSFAIRSFKDAGVFIIKDSSANKCGVICSSYEISAAMLLNEEEFFDNKEVIVNQVLDKLRSLARMEAELLFNEYESYPGKLWC